MIFKHILGDQGVMFDGKKFGWLGTPAPERHTCVLTEKTRIRNLEEWSAAKRPVKLASLGPGNATSALPQLLRAVLGLPINVVEVPIEVFGFVSQRFSISLSAFR
jgi:hypothetical protein